MRRPSTVNGGSAARLASWYAQDAQWRVTAWISGWVARPESSKGVRAADCLHALRIRAQGVPPNAVINSVSMRLGRSYQPVS